MGRRVAHRGYLGPNGLAPWSIASARVKAPAAWPSEKHTHRDLMGLLPRLLAPEQVHHGTGTPTRRLASHNPQPIKPHPEEELGPWVGRDDAQRLGISLELGDPPAVALPGAVGGEGVPAEAIQVVAATPRQGKQELLRRVGRGGPGQAGNGVARGTCAGGRGTVLCSMISGSHSLSRPGPMMNRCPTYLDRLVLLGDHGCSAQRETKFQDVGICWKALGVDLEAGGDEGLPCTLDLRNRRCEASAEHVERCDLPAHTRDPSTSWLQNILLARGLSACCVPEPRPGPCSPWSPDREGATLDRFCCNETPSARSRLL